MTLKSLGFSRMLLGYLLVTIILTAAYPFAQAATQAQYQVRPDGRYYEVLNIDHLATPLQIKAAFRPLAKKYYHGRRDDGQGGDRAKFEEALNAYKILLDPVKRAYYGELIGEKWPPEEKKEVEVNSPTELGLLKSPEARALWLLNQNPEKWDLQAARNVRTGFWSDVPEREFLISLMHYGSLNPYLPNAILGTHAMNLLIGMRQVKKFCETEMLIKNRY